MFEKFRSLPRATVIGPLVFLFFMALVLGGCTDNMMSRSGFGEMTVELPCGQKYLHSSWKDQSGELWYATRPFRSGETPETTIYKSKSQFGMWEGKVTFVEKVCP